MGDGLEKIIKEGLGWDVSDISMEFQEDGLTNENYIITKNSVQYAVRIAGTNSRELGIDRRAEFAAMKAVAAIGLGPEVLYFSTETGNMITWYIDGKKWTKEDVSTPENMKRIVEVIKKVHALPPIPYEFSPYKDIEERLQTALQRKIELPDSLDHLLKKLSVIKQERDQRRDEFWGLCHNDPFPNNFLDDGSVRLLDWEYAGMGDTFFDLACLSTSYSKEHKEALLQYYFGKSDTDLQNSLEQMSFVVSFWNATWALLQIGVPNPPRDYEAMAKKMFNKLENPQ